MQHPIQRPKQHPIIWPVYLITLLIFSACAAPPRAATMDTQTMDTQRLAPAAEQESAGIAQNGTTGSADEAGINPSGNNTAGNVETTRRIISTAHLELVVQDAAAAADQIAVIAGENGGYVGNTNLYKANFDGSETLRGTLSIRVPAEVLEQVIDELETLAVDVRGKTTERQDVTDQYADSEARLRTLQATETELLELLTEVRAKPNATADEIMAVYTRLTEIRTEIELLQGRLNLLDSRIALSTVEITLIPNPADRPVVQSGWQPGAEARSALRTLISATQGLGNLLIWAVIFILPLLLLMLIPLAIVAYLLRLIYRRYNRRKQSTPESTPAS